MVCGRRPIEDGKPNLLDWLCMPIERGELLFALDHRIKAKDGYSDEEVERLLNLGLLCAYPYANVMPTNSLPERLLITDESVSNTSDGRGLMHNLASASTWKMYLCNQIFRELLTILPDCKTVVFNSQSVCPNV